MMALSLHIQSSAHGRGTLRVWLLAWSAVGGPWADRARVCAPCVSSTAGTAFSKDPHARWLDLLANQTQHDVVHVLIYNFT